MPDAQPEIGVEFLASAVRNSDGSYTEAWLTVVDAQHRFTLRTVNSQAAARIRLVGPGGPNLDEPVPQGERQWNTGNRRWTQMERLELQGA